MAQPMDLRHVYDYSMIITELSWISARIGGFIPLYRYFHRHPRNLAAKDTVNRSRQFKVSECSKSEVDAGIGDMLRGTWSGQD